MIDVVHFKLFFSFRCTCFLFISTQIVLLNRLLLLMMLMLISAYKLTLLFFLLCCFIIICLIVMIWTFKTQWRTGAQFYLRVLIAIQMKWERKWKFIEMVFHNPRLNHHRWIEMRTWSIVPIKRKIEKNIYVHIRTNPKNCVKECTEDGRFKIACVRLFVDSFSFCSSFTRSRFFPSISPQWQRNMCTKQQQ